MFSFVTRTEFAPQPPRIHQQFAVMMQRLDRLQSLTRFNLFVVCCIFAGTQVRFKSGIRIWKTPPNRHRKLLRTHTRLPKTAHAQSRPPEALPRN